MTTVRGLSKPPQRYFDLFVMAIVEKHLAKPLIRADILAITAAL